MSKARTARCGLKYNSFLPFFSNKRGQNFWSDKQSSLVYNGVILNGGKRENIIFGKIYFILIIKQNILFSSVTDRKNSSRILSVCCQGGEYGTLHLANRRFA